MYVRSTQVYAKVVRQLYADPTPAYVAHYHEQLAELTLSKSTQHYALPYATLRQPQRIFRRTGIG